MTFRVQVGKGKSAYTTRWTFDNSGQAAAWYSGINVHSGYKKRLLGPDGNVLARILTC